MPKLTNQRLKQLLHYDPETGIFTWRKTGVRAGCINGQGYRQIKIDQRAYLCARLVWFYINKRWPKMIDHKNRKRDDDRFSNLRQATSQQNAFNMISKKTKLGMRNIFVETDRDKRYRVSLGRGTTLKIIGRFYTLKEAQVARDAAIKETYGEYAPAT